MKFEIGERVCWENVPEIVGEITHIKDNMCAVMWDNNESVKPSAENEDDDGLWYKEKSLYSEIPKHVIISLAIAMRHAVENNTGTAEDSDKVNWLLAANDLLRDAEDSIEKEENDT